MDYQIWLDFYTYLKQYTYFEIKNNSLIILDNKEYEYKTIELEDNNNIEYIHDIRIKDEQVKRTLMNLLIK